MTTSLVRAIWGARVLKGQACIDRISPIFGVLMALCDRHWVTFDTPGTYNFYCLIHPFMHGQVIVQ